jgi:hypothetical protein
VLNVHGSDDIMQTTPLSRGELAANPCAIARLWIARQTASRPGLTE